MLKDARGLRKIIARRVRDGVEAWYVGHSWPRSLFTPDTHGFAWIAALADKQAATSTK